MRGFEGNNIWHFLQVSSATRIGSIVRITVTNYATVDAMSGSLSYVLKDNSGNVGGSGTQTVTSIAASGTAQYDESWGTYTPTKVEWRWSGSLSYNQTNLT